MPNVPNVPGVPALSSFSAAASNVLLVADAAIVVSRALQPQWGLYLNGEPVIASSLAQLLGIGSLFGSLNSISSIFGGSNFSNQFSVVDFDYKKDWNIPDYPVEQGDFQSYNKVELPFDVKMRVAAGGSQSNRQALIDTVESIDGTLDLYDVVTPEKTYQNCNIDHVSYARSSTNGVGLIIIDIWLKEIRESATTATSNTQTPTIATQQNVGNVQTQTPTPLQEQSGFF